MALSEYSLFFFYSAFILNRVLTYLANKPCLLFDDLRAVGCKHRWRLFAVYGLHLNNGTQKMYVIVWWINEYKELLRTEINV